MRLCDLGQILKIQNISVFLNGTTVRGVTFVCRDGFSLNISILKKENRNNLFLFSYLRLLVN